MKKSIGGVLSVLCLLMLLFNPGLALEGARQGLVLWGNVVLPTLLPFMICSGVIVAMDAIHILTGPFKPILSGILSLSDQGSFCLMSGLLCGYPMGAKTTSDFLDQGRLSVQEGKYLLRKAFAQGGYLPETILWREKAAFSDAVGHSLADELKAYAESVYSDKAFIQGKKRYSRVPPFTKEALLYRDIFERHYPGQGGMIPGFWMPNKDWPGCDVADPSARVLANYGASGI